MSSESSDVSIGLYSLASSWDGDTVPSASTTVTIAPGDTIVVAANAEAYSITIDTGSFLLDEGYQIDAAGGLFIGDGTLLGAGTISAATDIEGGLGGNGVVVAAGGTLTIEGSADLTSANQPAFVIESSSTLAFDGSVGTAADTQLEAPVVAFDSNSGEILDLTGEGRGADGEVGKFHAVVDGFMSANSQFIEFAGSVNDRLSYNNVTHVVTIMDGTTLEAEIGFIGPGVDNLTAGSCMFQAGTTDVIGELVLCFAAGTRIRTPGGEVAVETLNRGDAVATLHGRPRPIKWIGRRSYDGRFIAGQTLKLPVCIRKNAIDANVPERDLLVSPGHAICIDGALVPAWRLLNGASITQAESVDSITYFHIELDDHEVIFAEGCPAETFLDDDFRNQFENAAEFAALYPDHQAAPPVSCPTRIEDGFQLEGIRRRLAARAGVEINSEQAGRLRGYVDHAGPSKVTGWAQSEAHPETPVCLEFLVDGKRVALALANRYRADLRHAGLGSGTHGFAVELPPGVTGRVEVRRTSDGAAVALTETAMTHAA